MLRSALLCVLTVCLLGAQTPSHLVLGRTALQRSHYSDAEKELRLAVAEAGDGPAKVEVLELLCDLELLISKYPDAVAAQEQAVAAWGDAPGLPAHLVRLAAAYRAAGRTAEAEKTLLQVLEAEKASGDELKIAAAGDSLGSLYLSLKRYADARKMYELGFNMRVKKLGGEAIEIASSYVNMGVVEEQDKKYVAARADFDLALSVSEKVLGTEDYRITGILDRIGALLRVQRRYNQAAPFYQRSLSIREKTLGPRHSEVAPALDNLAMTYFADGNFEQSEPLFKRALDVWTVVSGDLSPQIALELDNLAALYAAQKRYEEAEPYYKRALWLREKVELDNLNNLALLYETNKDYKRSEQYFQRALLIADKPLAGPHEELAAILEEYAILLDLLHRPLEATKARARVKALQAKP